MTASHSKTQIDRLGERLRAAPPTERDLKLLDDYRRAFADSFEQVVRAIRDRLSIEPTGRSAKSTGSILDKLRRESIRLSQVQDIAGCRIIVPDILEQDECVHALRGLFPRADVMDRRTKPSHGYRAVHVIAPELDRHVEIQVRTELQHLWAEMSEKLADFVGSSIKYGSGDPDARKFLMDTSRLVSVHEEGNLESTARLRDKELIAQAFRATIRDFVRRSP